MAARRSTLRVGYAVWWRWPLAWWANLCTFLLPPAWACRLAGHSTIEERPFIGTYEGPYCLRCDRHV